MNKYIYKMIMVAFILLFLPPIQVFAQSNDSFQIDTRGNVTLVSSHAALEGISSLQFSLEIQSNSADKVEFQFRPNTAQVSEFRYHEDTGILNVYIAGTEALFDENTESLTIGRVVVLDGNQNDTPATVSIVKDSLQYVYGSELRQAMDLQVPEAVKINDSSSASGGSDDPGASGGLQTPPTEDNTQNLGGSSSGSQGTGNSNNTQSQGNGKNMASGGQGSGSNTANGQSQSSDNNGVGSRPLAENYNRLKQTFENARTLKEEDYSSESYEALQAAIAKAEEVLGDPNATSEEIDGVLIELENAIGAMVAREDDLTKDSQQSGGQETGGRSDQTESAGAGKEKGGGLMQILLMIAGILVLVGCGAAGAAAVVFKMRSK